MRYINKIFLASVLCFLLIGNVPAFAAEDQKDESAKTEETKVKKEKVEPFIIPEEKDFQPVAENKNLTLKADSESGHFIVYDKRNGHVYRSFPNPEGWEEGGASNLWQSHLQSPFMFSYVEFNERKDVVKESNLLSQGGTVDFAKDENGFKVTYQMDKLGFTIPIQVELGEDFVETTVLADDIIDGKEVKETKDKKAKKDPKSRLVSIRLFPFLGAETSEREDGYLVLPDGPGALVEFKKNRATANNLYDERVYGEDWAFSAKASLSPRQPVYMPVFGIKNQDQALLGVIQQGDTYADIVSAPSESLSQYNWVTAQHNFRFKYFQETNRKKAEGYYTYSEDMQRTNRSVRYYMIDKKKDPTYADLAQRYRDYLIEQQDLEKTESSENIELQLSLIGGGTSEGFFFDTYLPLTTAEQATEIVRDLNHAGIENMAINYYGWERGGYDKYGGAFPVARKLGGNEGMADFIQFSQSKDFSVYLDASSYAFNNTGKDGFRSNRDGLRDLSSNVIKFSNYRDTMVFVSPLFMEKTIEKDLDKLKELGADGFLFGPGVGATLNSDYNDKYFLNRHEAKTLQEDVLAHAKKKLGDARVYQGNFYSLANSSHIEQMADEYSYDLFIDRKIPFAQIALHGLVSYSTEYANIGGSTQENFLQGIEYGALPSFILTYEKSQKLLESRSLREFYSTYYKDWEHEMITQYQNFNEALGDVQDQFIVDHMMLKKGVFKTTFENGKSIIVNYNKKPYEEGGQTVEAENYLVVEGGD